MGCLPSVSPSTHPSGELQVAAVGSVLYFVSLGDVIMFIFSLCNLFYTLYVISEGEKKCWKVFKARERLALKRGEVTNQGDKHLGRLCQGCLWLGLGAEASEMVTTLFSPCFLFPFQWKNSLFSPAPSFTSAFGWWQADKSTAEYFLWASLPCRGKPTIPVECVLWVLTSSQRLLPTDSLSSLCRHLGRGGIHHCHARGPSSELLVRNSLHSACSSA